MTLVSVGAMEQFPPKKDVEEYLKAHPLAQAADKETCEAFLREAPMAWGTHNFISLNLLSIPEKGHLDCTAGPPMVRFTALHYVASVATGLQEGWQSHPVICLPQAAS